MTLNISYGIQLQTNFLDAGEILAKDVHKGKFFEISKKLNNSFFGGSTFQPKSFSMLLSVEIPKGPSGLVSDPNTDLSYVNITKKRSLGAVLSNWEGIPVIGSAIAAINVIYHLFGMLSSRSKLKKVVKELNNTERSAYNIGRGQCYSLSNKVFNAAIKYTVNQNRLAGSLLSLIPFVKPIVRIAQVLIFKAKSNSN